MQAAVSARAALRISRISRPYNVPRTVLLSRRLLAARPRSFSSSEGIQLQSSGAMKHGFESVRKGEDQDGTSEVFKLRIISYNILAQCYIKGELFPYAPKNSLKWKNRSQVLGQELLSFDADFICLQELDMFAEFFRPLMEQHGYACLYKQRPNRKNDGCGIFYRSDRFTLLQRRDVDFNDLVPEEESPQEPPSKMPRTSDGAVSDAGRASFEASVGTSVASQIIENDSASQNGAAVEPVGVAQTLGGLADRLIRTGNEAAGTSGSQPAASATHSAAPRADTSRGSGSAEGGDATKSGVKAVRLTGLAERLVKPEAKASGPPAKDFATAARFSKEHRLQRDCVAVMGAFRPVGGTKGTFVVANTHIYWDPQWIDVKLAQAEYLLYSLSNFLDSLSEGARGSVPAMLCGDFNSQPGDRVYRYITSAKLPEDTSTVEGKARKVDIESAANKLFVAPAPVRLFSAHERSGGEPPFTNFTPKFTGTLDYCFLTANMVPRLVGRKSTPDDTEKELGVGIPNQLYPSDHLPIGFDFEIERRSFR